MCGAVDRHTLDFYVGMSTYFSLYTHSTILHRPRSIKQSVQMFVSHEVERFGIASENAQLVGGLAELAYPVRAGDFEEKHVIVLKFGNDSGWIHPI